MFFPLVFHHSKAMVIVLRMKCVLAVCMMYLLILLQERKKSVQYRVCLCRRCKNSAVATVTEFYEAILYFASGTLHYSYRHQCYVCK